MFIFFGYEATVDFLKNNELLTIIRAHEVQYEGYRAYHWGNSIFPVLMTVFSAPNYCGHHQNKGAILKIHQNEIQIMQYSFTEKNELSLDFPDVFVATWEVLKDGINEISNNLQRKIIKNGFNEDISDPILEKEFDMIYEKIKRKSKFKVNESDTGKSNLRPIKVGIRKSKSRSARPRSLHPKGSKTSRTLFNSKNSHSVTNLLNRPKSITSTNLLSKTPSNFTNSTRMSNQSFGHSSVVYQNMKTSNNPMSYSTLQSSRSGYSYNKPTIKVTSTLGAMKHSGVVTRRNYDQARSSNVNSEKRP